MADKARLSQILNELREHSISRNVCRQSPTGVLVRMLDSTLEALGQDAAPKAAGMRGAPDALDRNAVSGFLQDVADTTGRHINARALGLGIYAPHPVTDSRPEAPAGPTPPIPEAVAEALAKSLIMTWEAVVGRFGKGLEP